MKTNLIILVAVAVATFAITGCNKQGGETGAPPAAPAVSVDTSKLTAAFQSAEPALKSAVDTAVTAIKNADYSDALKQLQALSGKFTLTDEQQTAVKNAIAAVQKAIADAAAKTAAGASKAAADAANALPK